MKRSRSKSKKSKSRSLSKKRSRLDAEYYIKVHDESLLKDEKFRSTILKRVLQHLIDKGEIDIETKPRGSNYLSFVFPGTQKIAYQVFVVPEVTRRIKDIVDRVPKNVTARIMKSTPPGKRPRKVYYNFNYTYDSHDFLPITGKNEMEDVLEWQKIIPLNTIKEKGKINSIITSNFLKFCWDVNKSLYALNKAGFTHDDCCVDNIGINDKGNFCLFDFDRTKPGDDIRADIDYLNASLKFRGLDLEVPYGLNTLVGKIYDQTSDSGEKIVDDLDALKIKGI